MLQVVASSSLWGGRVSTVRRPGRERRVGAGRGGGRGVGTGGRVVRGKSASVCYAGGDGDGGLAGSASPQAAAMPEAMRAIVGAFQMVPDQQQRYKQLLYFASKLDALDAAYQVDENKVVGCVSQVWVRGVLGEDGRMRYQAESDSALTKGLAALLVKGLSGATPAEVLGMQPTFVDALGLGQSLTPSRTNGFLNMFKMMQRIAMQELAKAEADPKPGDDDDADDGDDCGGDDDGCPAPWDDEGEDEATAVIGDPQRPVWSSMMAKLQRELQPVSLTVDDESGQHAGHGGSKGLRAGETHFAVDVVSAAFEGQNSLKRHRTIYAILDEEIKGGVHALRLSTKTPAEAGL